MLGWYCITDPINARGLAILCGVRVSQLVLRLRERLGRSKRSTFNVNVSMLPSINFHLMSISCRQKCEPSINVRGGFNFLDPRHQIPARACADTIASFHRKPFFCQFCHLKLTRRDLNHLLAPRVAGEHFVINRVTIRGPVDCGQLVSLLLIKSKDMLYVFVFLA